MADIFYSFISLVVFYHPLKSLNCSTSCISVGFAIGTNLESSNDISEKGKCFSAHKV